MVLFKGNVAQARNFIAIDEYVSSPSSEYQACVLCLDFWLPEIKTGVAKESSATGYKYIDRFIRKWIFFVNQAYKSILCNYTNLSLLLLKSQVECEFERKLSKVYCSFAM